jgi:hypothetical protein
MPRFVVLRHELPPGSSRTSHYDLMLELGGVLQTWACDELPAAGRSVLAQRLADHRLAYLDYEGPVSGDRGTVSRIAAGEYQQIAETADERTVRLMGEGLRGVLTIRQLPGEPQRWRVSLAEG